MIVHSRLRSAVLVASSLSVTFLASVATHAGTVTRTGFIPKAVSSHAAAPLPGKGVLITGGFNRGFSFSSVDNQAAIWEPATNVFRRLTNRMIAARSGHTATLLPSGTVLIVGGGDPLSELFDPALESFAATGRTSGFHSGHSATLLDDGRVLIGSRPMEVYLPASGTFRLTTNQPAIARDPGHSATKLCDGRILFAGGFSRTMEIFDPIAETFTSVPTPMSEARVFHIAVRISCNEILFVGGENSFRFPAEIFNVSAGTFSPITTTVFLPRVGLGTLLSTGEVLIATTNSFPSFLLFDPRTRSFRQDSVREFFSAEPGSSITPFGAGFMLIEGGLCSSRGDGIFYTPIALGAAPTITSISPAVGKTTGGTVVTITGTNFSAQTQLNIGSVTSVTPTQIIARTSSNFQAATVDVTVTNPDAQSARLTQGFRYFVREYGDVNGDERISVADVFYMINMLFTGGPPPVD